MDDMAPSAGESIATLPEQDGAATLRYRVWPAKTSPRATLAVLSGVMSNTAWFRPLAERWRALDYRVIGVERRGSGLNVGHGRGDTPSAKVLVEDARRVVEHGRAEGRPLVIVGWCWGAILGVHLGHALGDAVDGMALLTPGLYPSPTLSARMKALAVEAKGQDPETPVLESPIEDEMFTSGPALDGFIRQDEARWRRFSPRFLDVSSRLTMMARMRLRKLQTPLLVVLAEDDATTDNEKILAELSRLRDASASVQTTTLPGAHGLQFDAPQALAERLDAWARDTLGV